MRTVPSNLTRLKGLLKKAIPPSKRRAIKLRGQRLLAWPPVGSLSFGSFDRVSPISKDWGFDRGLPVDRFYIEQFLKANSAAIAGRVVEIGDAGYTRKFGRRDLIQRSDVLHVQSGHPDTTIVADLTNAPELGSEIFDCLICTQTLNFVYDFRAALATIYRLMKPDGVALLTVAGVSQISVHDLHQWGDYWRFTSYSTDTICREAGPWQNVRVQTYGNVHSSAAFLYGIASEELSPEALEHVDPQYQLIIAARLQK